MRYDVCALFSNCAPGVISATHQMSGGTRADTLTRVLASVGEGFVGPSLDHM